MDGETTEPASPDECRPRLPYTEAGRSRSGPLESEHTVEELAVTLNGDSEHLGVRALLGPPPRQVCAQVRERSAECLDGLADQVVAVDRGRPWIVQEAQLNLAPPIPQSTGRASGPKLGHWLYRDIARSQFRIRSGCSSRRRRLFLSLWLLAQRLVSRPRHLGQRRFGWRFLERLLLGPRRLVLLARFGLDG